MGQVELWIGRAGSGKSQRVATEIAHEVRQRPLGGKIFWIVPETVSFAAERRLVEAVHSTVRAEVLSLSRLALRIQSEMQVVAGNPVNTTGQRLLLARVLREVESSLSVLHRAKPTLSFLDTILEAFEEMSAHRVSMEQLESTLQIASTQIDSMDHSLDAQTGRSLLGKLGDLCTLYFLYRRALERQNLYDESELMDRVQSVLRECSLLRGATIYIDGFRDMQPRELHFALALAEVCEKTTLIMSADPRWFSTGISTDITEGNLSRLLNPIPTLTSLVDTVEHPGDVFAPESIRLYREWMHACAEAGIEPGVVTFPPHHMAAQAEALDSRAPGMLDYLEQQVVSEGRPGELWRGGSQTQLLRVAASQHIRAEVGGVARDILSQVYHHDVPFSDTMVVVPHLADYAPLIREVFTRHEIPFNLADPPALTTHPLVKFILGAMAAVEENISTNSVLRMLKTEFCNLSREDADWLEGYLVAQQVSGIATFASEEEWNFAQVASDRGGDDPRAQAEDARANRLRKVIGGYLVPFVRKLGVTQCTPLAVAETIWELLDAVRAKRRMASWLVDEGNTEDPQAASVHEQVWQRILGILDDLSLYSGDETETQLPRGFVFESIRTDIASQTLSAVPAALESVIVTDIERASALHMPIVYVLGLHDGALPRRIHPTGILQDEERSQFAVLFGQRLGDTASERQLAEQWRVYTTLTRATRRLTLCYPMAGSDGKELRPSSVISRVQSLFHEADLPSLWFAEGDGLNPEDVIWTPATALHWLLSTLREVRHGEPVPRGVSSIYRWLSSQTAYAQRLNHGLKGLFQRSFASPLSPPDALALFGKEMQLNVYQLETYASCPYRHFIQYGLKLSEPAERDATRAERGTLIHAALAEFVTKWRQEPERWRQMEDAEARTSMQEVFRDLLDRPQFAIWSRSRIRSEQAAEALQVAMRAAVTLTRHTRYSHFVPTHLELSFGTTDDGAYPAYILTLKDSTRVALRGRIDRIDVAEEDGIHRFRIIDYKSRTMDIDLGKVYHGLRLQLPLYSAVVQAISAEMFGRESKAAGFFYLPLVRKMETQNAPENEEQARQKAIGRMQARGLWRDDGVSIDWMDSRLKSSGDSELFPTMYKKDASLTKRAPALCESDFETMERFVFRKVEELATGIHRGDIQISPHAFDRQDFACKTCSFSAICQIDSRWDKSPQRLLPRLNKDEVLEKWTALEHPDAAGEEEGK